MDGTPNKRGEISHYARGLLTINGRIFPTTFLIAGLGSKSIILGLPWLRRINPVIDWKIGTFHKMPVETRKGTIKEIDDEEIAIMTLQDTISRIVKAKGSPQYAYGQNIWIRAKTSVSQHLTHKKEGDPEQKTLDKLLPEQYKEYRWIFEKEASERFPESRPWDHVIELKTDFTAKDYRVYPLSPAEQKKLNESLQKGYI
ncbi:hypothetical protein L208DRAFT_1294857 [Tricholoma matsutake]|nr:hypothetical protein L208DRAFT_1294857 [Tricholoma matsutake 945]